MGEPAASRRRVQTRRGQRRQCRRGLSAALRAQRSIAGISQRPSHGVPLGTGHRLQQRAAAQCAVRLRRAQQEGGSSWNPALELPDIALDLLAHRCHGGRAIGGRAVRAPHARASTTLVTIGGYRSAPLRTVFWTAPDTKARVLGNTAYNNDRVSPSSSFTTQAWPSKVC